LPPHRLAVDVNVRRADRSGIQVNRPVRQRNGVLSWGLWVGLCMAEGLLYVLGGVGDGVDVGFGQIGAKIS
jgi:hypothetical protein